MAFGTRVQFNPIGTAAHGAISGTYSTFGAKLPGHARIICITNSTNADILVSADGVTDQLIVVANSFKLFDFSTNRIQNDGLFVPEGTQFYVRSAGSPTTGNAYIEVITAAGGV